jgi:folate-binding protein YgfZ
MMMISLPKPQLLGIAGADAVAFAHAQFSSDVRGLLNGQWQWSAWLSPQGRVRAFFHLIRDDDEHLRLLLRGGGAGELRSALAPYILRAKVALSAIDDTDAVGTFDARDGRADADALALPGSPPRWLMLRRAAATDASGAPAATEQWRLADIRAGLPELDPALQDQFLPQWLGLDRLGAVSVKKGCYPGQEVMSRLHFKGGNKRALYRLQLQAAALPAPGGALLLAAGRENAGQIVMAARGEGGIEALASLIEAASGESLRAADPAITDLRVAQRFA